MARKAREQELEGVNVLELAPVRLAAWEDQDGRIVVLRPRPETGGLRGLVDRIFHRLSARRIRLDEVGGYAWLHLDGRRTVGEVAALMREEFGGRVDPAEERLGQMVLILRREGLLAYPGWDEIGTRPTSPQSPR
jgi:hypothetical protein